jgi:hypothetical protein
MHLLVDSTGLRLCGAGEWLLEKHGTKTRRSWRKLHIGLDAGMGQIVAASLTAKEADDGAEVGPLLDQITGVMASFTGDGGYDQDPVYASMAEHYPEAAVVPPRTTAVPSDAAETAQTQRDRHLQHIAEHGRITCHGIEAKPAYQHGPAAVAVGERAVDELPDSQAHDIEADSELQRSRAGAQIAAASGSAGTKICMASVPLKVISASSQNGARRFGVGAAGSRLRSRGFLHSLGQLLADLLQHLAGNSQIRLGQAAQGLLAHLAGHRLDLFDLRLAQRGQQDGLGTSVGGFLPPLDQAQGLQPVEQADHRGTVQRQRGREFLLPQGRRGAGQVQQGQPGGFGQAKGLQAQVNGTAPLSRGQGHHPGKAIPQLLRFHTITQRLDEISSNDIASFGKARRIRLLPATLMVHYRAWCWF